MSKITPPPALTAEQLKAIHQMWEASVPLWFGVATGVAAARDKQWLDMLAQQADQALPSWANAAFAEISGCFHAAMVEGLLEALAATQDEHLKDLVERRLLYAHPIADQAARIDEWKPTAENINALPEPVRRFIHDLAANADPAGTVRELAQMKDVCRELEASNRMLRDAEPGALWGAAVRWTERTHGIGKGEA